MVCEHHLSCVDGQQEIPMQKIEPFRDDLIETAIELLGADQLVAMPTETVYGLAANAWSEEAVGRIFAAKNRPPSNPLIVHVASVDRLNEAVAMPLDSSTQQQLDSLVDLWPGPLSLVLPKSDRIPACVTAGRSTVAVRIPSHPIANALLEKCPFPLAAPSANQSKYVSPTTAQHCAQGLSEHIKLILDGGPCQVGVESTIVLLDPEAPCILRPGFVTSEEIADRLGQPLQALCRDDENPTELLAPGMMLEHYSPRTPLQRLSAVSPDADLSRMGRIAFQPVANGESEKYATVAVLSLEGDLHEVARGLFAAFRRLDQQALDGIVVDECDAKGLGLAIMDRIDRAAAKWKPD
jgi:L-threonylcarbamoyladenylate synthase